MNLCVNIQYSTNPVLSLLELSECSVQLLPLSLHSCGLLGTPLLHHLKTTWLNGRHFIF